MSNTSGGNILLGRNISARLNELTKADISALKENAGIQPTLAIITSGESNALKMSEMSLHENFAKQLGINVVNLILDDSIEEQQFIDVINQYNNNPLIHSILVLLPLPDQLNQQRILATIAEDKEIEGLNIVKNKDDLFEGKQISTISSLFLMLESINYNLYAGKNILLIEDWIFESNPVVRRLLELATSLNIEFEVVKASTPNIQALASQADLLILSLETPELIDKNYVKADSVIIDFNPIHVGDVYSEEKGRVVPILKTCLNVESALTKAKHVAPSLGGIGPIALANLMRNFVYNCQLAITPVINEKELRKANA